MCIEELVSVSPHIRSTDGRTVLMISAGDETCLDTFHDIGENSESVNMKDAEGRTTLMISAGKEDVDDVGNVDHIQRQYNCH